MKWMGFFLSEHTTSLTDDKNKVDMSSELTKLDKLTLINQLYVDRLKGRQILSLDSVVGETEKCVIVYIFNYYDCETCIDKGFEIVNLIDNSKKENM